MTAESIITLAGTVVTILFAALHLSGRIAKIETKVDLMISGLIYVKRHPKDNEDDR